MSLGTDITFVEKYHRIIIEILLILATIGGVCYVKDNYHAEELAKQNTQIASLMTNGATLLAAKTVADNNATNAMSLYQQEHNKLIAFLTKKQVSPTAPLAPLPGIPAFSSLDDCNKTVQQLSIDNNQCATTVQSLQADKVADQAVITNLTTTVDKVVTENTEVKKDNTSLTKTKNFWRDTAIGATLIDIGIILAHAL